MERRRSYLTVVRRLGNRTREDRGDTGRLQLGERDYRRRDRRVRRIAAGKLLKRRHRCGVRMEVGESTRCGGADVSTWVAKSAEQRRLCCGIRCKAIECVDD